LECGDSSPLSFLVLLCLERVTPARPKKATQTAKQKKAAMNRRTPKKTAKTAKQKKAAMNRRTPKGPKQVGIG
jgi:hypothetical protein